jgi:RecB family exonuclease
MQYNGNLRIIDYKTGKVGPKSDENIQLRMKISKIINTAKRITSHAVQLHDNPTSAVRSVNPNAGGN